MRGALFLALLCTLLSCCHSYPSGAPTSACSSLTPKHKSIQPRRDAHSYTVTANKVGGKIIVTITSPVGEEFRGFMLQARSSRDRGRMVDGQFTRENELSQTINCFGGRQNTLTHENPEPKRKITTEWTPAYGVKDDVIFRATVAETYDRFWIDIDSSSVRVQNNVVEGSQGEQNKDMDSSNIYDNCSISKGCFGLPSNCVSRGDCEIFLSYNSSGDGISFKMYGFLEPSSYMAMGLSNDKLMGEDFVTECFLQNGRITIRESWNDRRSNQPIREIPEGMYKGENKNDLTVCSWTKPYMVNEVGRSLKFDLANDTHYIFLAKGPMSGDRLRHHSDKSISSETVNFTAFNAIGGERVNDSVKIHGTFMITAWVGLVSLAIILARHFKSAWDSRTIFGVKVWFAFHRGLMILALIFVIVAFIVIFVYKDGWSGANPHSVLGCIATALGLFQPIMAAFRPSPDHPKRPIFNWLHWAVGNSAQIIAVVTIFYAVTLRESGLKESFYWVMAIFVIVHCIFHLLFQLHSWMTAKKKNNEVRMLEMNGGRVTNGGQSNLQDQNLTGNVFRILLLGIYGIFLVVIIMALYSIIGIA